MQSTASVVKPPDAAGWAGAAERWGGWGFCKGAGRGGGAGFCPLSPVKVGDSDDVQSQLVARLPVGGQYRPSRAGLPEAVSVSCQGRGHAPFASLISRR